MAVSTSIVKTLMEREWVRVVGHRDVPGRPAMYATTRQFLDYFNLKSLDQLPPLAEIKELDNLSGELALELRDAGQNERLESDGSAEVEAVSSAEADERGHDEEDAEKQ